jgi:hypothetical protein
MFDWLLRTLGEDTSSWQSPRREPFRFQFEKLEERAMLSAFSIGDASVSEGDITYRFTDEFVGENGYGLAAARNILVGPDGNVYVASHDTDSVKVFEGGTGRFLRTLVRRAVKWMVRGA